MTEPTLRWPKEQYNSGVFEKRLKNIWYSLSFHTSTIYIFYKDERRK